MIVPVWIFSAMLWVAVIAIAAGAIYLLVVLVREWKSDELW